VSRCREGMSRSRLALAHRADWFGGEGGGEPQGCFLSASWADVGLARQLEPRLDLQYSIFDIRISH
jgi:hypothetical protein